MRLLTNLKREDLMYDLACNQVLGDTLMEFAYVEESGKFICITTEKGHFNQYNLDMLKQNYPKFIIISMPERVICATGEIPKVERTREFAYEYILPVIKGNALLKIIACKNGKFTEEERRELLSNNFKDILFQSKIKKGSRDIISWERISRETPMLTDERPKNESIVKYNKEEIFNSLLSNFINMGNDILTEDIADKVKEDIKENKVEEKQYNNNVKDIEKEIIELLKIKNSLNTDILNLNSVKQKLQDNLYALKAIKAEMEEKLIEVKKILNEI